LLPAVWVAVALTRFSAASSFSSQSFSVVFQATSNETEISAQSARDEETALGFDRARSESSWW
jgi:hypothetical protein